MNTLNISYSWGESESESARVRADLKRCLTGREGRWDTFSANLVVEFNGQPVHYMLSEAEKKRYLGYLEKPYLGDEWILFLLEMLSPHLESFTEGKHVVISLLRPTAWVIEKKKDVVLFGLSDNHDGSRICAAIEVSEAEFTKAMFGLYDSFIRDILSLNPNLKRNSSIAGLIRTRAILKARLAELEKR